MRNKIITISFFIIIVFTFLSCKDSITNPNEEPPTRNYTWTADTIVVPWLSSVDQLYGANEDEIWLVGENYFNDEYSVFRYVGNKFYPSGKIIASPTNITGTGRDDIWIITFNGEFWHYNGYNWELKDTLLYEEKQVQLLSIVAIDKNTYYASGLIVTGINKFSPIVCKMSNNKWKIDKVFNQEGQFISIKYSPKFQKIYFQSFEIGTHTRVIYRYEEKALVKVFETSGSLSWDCIENDIYFTETNYNNTERILYRLTDKGYEKTIDFTGSIYKVNLKGRSLKDIFFYAFGDTTTGIGHFNGKDMQFVYKTPLWGRVISTIGDNVYSIMYNPVSNKYVLISGKRED